MLVAVSQLADLALFFLTVIVVGKKPSAAKVTAIICTVAIVDLGFVALVAAQAQMNPFEWYQQQLRDALALYTEVFGGQAEFSEDMIVFAAGITPAAYLMQSALYVFIGLCIRWVADRVREKSEWTPFSSVDLSIWWLMPLLAGIVCYIVSLFVQDSLTYPVQMLAANLVMVSGIPLFVQGAAAGKGIMNKMGLSLTWQIVLGVLGFLSGLLFIVIPLVGLVDFWANFRGLAREGDTSELCDEAK